MALLGKLLPLFFLLVVDPISALQSATATLLSRYDFLLKGASVVPVGLASALPSSTLLAANYPYVDILQIPLTFLPRGGCLAVKLSLLDDRSYSQRIFGYFAICDTGSPFVTAPPTITRFSKDESRRFPPTKEQYGQTVGSMQWRSVPNIEILSNNYETPLTLAKLTVGLPESNVVDTTGGIFLGLIWKDDSRPRFLHQCGYTSFVLDYKQRLLTLSKQSTVAASDPATLQLFDFSPYGKDVYHYGVECQAITLLQHQKNPEVILSLKRPVIAVIDSGLTGCIFSDSLRDDILLSGVYETGFTLEKVIGLQVNLTSINGKTLTLSTNPKYWSLSCFKLPWFDNDETHPHVIACGATFLADSKICIDAARGRAKIEL